MKDSRPIAVFDGYWGPNWKVSFEYNLNSFFGPEIRSGWGSILQVSGTNKAKKKGTQVKQHSRKRLSTVTRVGLLVISGISVRNTTFPISRYYHSGHSTLNQHAKICLEGNA